MKRLDSLLKCLIKENGFDELIEQQNAIDVWNAAVGRVISEKTEPILVENGVISVKVKNSSWRQELQLQKDHIIKRVNRQLNKKTIKDIRFV